MIRPQLRHNLSQLVRPIDRQPGNRRLRLAADQYGENTNFVSWREVSVGIIQVNASLGVAFSCESQRSPISLGIGFANIF